MKKQKKKSFLIENYIKIYTISFNCCYIIDESSLDFSGKQMLYKIQRLSSHLLHTYEKVIFKFGFMDLSYTILKKELQDATNKIPDFKLTELSVKKENLDKYYDMLVKHCVEFKAILNKLSLSAAEKNYLIQNLTV